jgi:hypothetical protein
MIIVVKRKVSYTSKTIARVYPAAPDVSLSNVAAG